MRCTHAKKRISEYVDGGLDERRAAELEKHLAVCPACRETLEDFQGIVRQARSLKTVVPPDAAWQGIIRELDGARLDELRKRAGEAPLKPARSFFPARHPLWSAAAAALVIIVGGLALLRPWSSGTPSRFTDRDRFTLAKLDEARGFYRQAIKALNQAAAAQKGSLDPKVAAAFAKNLAMVDASIEACQAAVRRDPGNVDIQNFLLAAYRDKVDILTDLISVKKESGSNPVVSAKTSL
jgi:tetratricopeptide (TPR) repeat protein